MGADSYHGDHRKQRRLTFRRAGTAVLIGGAVASAGLGLTTAGGSGGGTVADELTAPADSTTGSIPVISDNTSLLELELRAQQAKAARAVAAAEAAHAGHAAHEARLRAAAEAAAEAKAAAAAAQAASEAAPAPSPTDSSLAVSAPKPAASAAAVTPVKARAGGSSLSARLLAEAETAQGTPYLWGGDAPGGFDCSGLIYWAAGQLGIPNMPRDTYDMLSAGVASGLLVPTSDPQPGDLAFFGSDHVELYVSSTETYGAQQSGTLVGLHPYGGSYRPTAFYYVNWSH